MDQGFAALIVAAINAFVVVVGLFFNWLISTKRIQKESELNIHEGATKERRDFLQSQLVEFYNPIIALLSINREIHDKIGPSSNLRRNRTYPEQETAEIWNELVETVIIPNNARACNIIETKSHLISSQDHIEPYLKFIKHAYTYQVFRKKPYEAYELFQFPNDLLEHVQYHHKALGSVDI